MIREPLLEALSNSNPGRFGEINLLLEVLSRGNKSLDIIRRALIEMAGKSDGAIKPDEYILIGRELHLLREKDNELELTEFGHQVMSASDWPPYDRLSQPQIELLAPELVGHPEIRFTLLSFISRLTRLPDKRHVYLLGSQKLREDETICIQMLQALGFFTINNGYLSISHEGLMELFTYIGESPFQSEEDLWQILHETNLRAMAAEKFVLKYEQERLKSAGRNDLYGLVKRVSEDNVKAGYDIRSFNLDGTTRYIEVKSSKNLTVQFYLTNSELLFANNHPGEYWIYFVPRSQDLPNLKRGPIMMFDLSGLIKEGTLCIEPNNFRVTAKRNLEEATDPRIYNML